MAQATETFALGGTQVTTVVEIDLSTVWLISGDFAGTIPQGQVGFINGNVNLTGDLIVEGLLTGIDTFTLQGNGFQLLAQNGGQINLQGVPKTSWGPWGITPAGWQVGDYLHVAPTAANVFVMSAVFWTGSWGTRPVASLDVTLPDGQIVKPEVANLIRSITLKNLSRIHFHDGAGVQTLKHVAVVDSGITGVLAKYPIHFHLNGEASRGSLLEGVVVVNGKNHAFVVHGSHGVTLRNCVAANTINDAYWWDPPVGSPTVLQKDHTANNSNDTLYDHCLATRVSPVPGDNGFRLTAFMMGAGSGNQCIDSVATCVQGQADASGFQWLEAANQNVGGNRWVFEGNTSHNNKVDGIFVWQNDSNPHVIDGYKGYRNGGTQVEHGAYDNNYDYLNMVLMGGTQGSFRLHAVGNILLGNVVADTPLRIEKHNSDATVFAIVRNCQFPSVIYAETGNVGTKLSKIRYENLGLVPVNFSMGGAVQASVAEIYEAGLLTHRWTGGVWT